MERNCDGLAILFWKRAYPDVDHEALADELFEKNLAKHLRNLPHLDERETHFHPDYSYKRAEVVKEFIVKNVESNIEKIQVAGSEKIEKQKENK